MYFCKIAVSKTDRKNFLTLFGLILALFVFGCSAGKGGNGSGGGALVGDGTNSGAVLTGTISGPGGSVAFNAFDLVVPRAFAASSAIGGALVTAYSVDSKGNITGDALASATANGSGAYSLQLPASVSLSSLSTVLVASTPSDTSKSYQAFVTKNNVDVGLDTNATVSAIKAAIATDNSATLSQVSLNSVNELNQAAKAILNSSDPPDFSSAYTALMNSSGFKDTLKNKTGTLPTDADLLKLVPNLFPVKIQVNGTDSLNRTFEIGDTITFNADAADPLGLSLEFEFIWKRSCAAVSTQTWSSSKIFSWKLTDADVSSCTKLVVKVRNTDGVFADGADGDVQTEINISVSPAPIVNITPQFQVLNIGATANFYFPSVAGGITYSSTFGTINPATGAFTAPLTAGQGTVTARDASGKTSTATVVVVNQNKYIDSHVDHKVCAIADNGGVYCWGMLGSVGVMTPKKIPGENGQGDLSGIVSVGGGGDNIAAIGLTNAGTVYSWGWKSEWGNSNIIPPTKVPGVGGVGILSNIVQITSGGTNCAVSNAGSVYCWGSNQYGTLGNNSRVNSDNPVQVVGVNGVGFLSDIVSVAGSGVTTCALSKTGRVYCWGYNGFSQLGAGNNATGSTYYTPIEVQGPGGTGVLSGIVKIQVGGNFVCALSYQGKVYCWGGNSYGQLGNNSVTQSLVPMEVSGVGGMGTLQGIKDIEAGAVTACAISAAGNAYCWGSNADGELGNNYTADTAYPVAVLGVGGYPTLANVKQMTVGVTFACALDSGQHAYCWGTQAYGELGNNSLTTSLVPVRVQGPGGGGQLSGIGY